MEWLNYHHLLYFWTVVRTGSIARACEELRLAPQTISTQLHQLEVSLGEKLLERSGRQLVPTEMGRVAFRFANEIFALGREFLDTVKDRPTGRPLRLMVGVADVLPKLIAYQLLAPALHLGVPIQLICRENTPERLLAELAVHELDVVLSDAPVGSNVRVRAYSHLLGETGVTFVGTAQLAAKLKRRFPRSLHNAPMLLPTENTAVRRSLDVWFEAHDIRPDVVGQFEDHALLRVFGEAGVGVFPTPSILENQLRRQYGLHHIGRVREVRGRFYAISVERKLKHPAVVAICQKARQELFG